MNNFLSGPVQVLNIPLDQVPPIIAPPAASAAPVVWYTPEGFPTVETDATILDIDGELLLVTNGWQLKIIAVTQVKRWKTGKGHERREDLHAEQEDYDAQA